MLMHDKSEYLNLNKFERDTQLLYYNLVNLYFAVCERIDYDLSVPTKTGFSTKLFRKKLEDNTNLIFLIIGFNKINTILREYI